MLEIQSFRNDHEDQNHSSTPRVVLKESKESSDRYLELF